MTKEGNDYDGSFYFLVDEVRFAFKDGKTGSGNGAPSGSATINVELMAGQIVRIENDQSTVLYGSHAEGYMYSWFTGYLICAL